ncbi:MAG TPA: phytanoyl-CoA dioxygenase family protein [Gaiellaceae bacterium]|nr:phytanoyl-CoA dioxygenase family protein [Gaiellaceae bacterium]
MHRTRTRFAARINRVATGLERRGVVATYELHDRLLANRASRRRYDQTPPQLDEVQQDVVDRLRDEGYATLPLSDLVTTDVWTELEANAAEFVAHTEAGLAGEREGSDSTLRRRAGKEFLIRKYAWGVQLGLDDPWLRLGTNLRLLDLANAYLGMWSKLEYVDVWYTPPAAADERRSSQRWHRDFNDRHLLKAFVYLVDVDEETGPFEYVPRSAPGGELDRLWPWRPLGDNYPPEDELERRIDGRAVTFTATKGTIIFCNTSGFHRGGFAKTKPRVLATFTWDSPASLKALSERNFTLASPNGEPLSEAQQYALT